MEEHSKFIEAEMVVGGLGFLLIDGLCFLIDLIPVVGWVITAVIQMATTFAIEQWISNKGGEFSGFTAKRFLKYLTNAVPYLPTTFTIFLVSALMHNHPKITKVVGKMAGPAAGKVLKKAA